MNEYRDRRDYNGPTGSCIITFGCFWILILFIAAVVKSL